jgi:hypothetical protein
VLATEDEEAMIDYTIDAYGWECSACGLTWSTPGVELVVRPTHPMLQFGWEARYLRDHGYVPPADWPDKWLIIRCNHCGNEFTMRTKDGGS